VNSRSAFRYIKGRIAAVFFLQQRALHKSLSSCLNEQAEFTVGDHVFGVAEAAVTCPDSSFGAEGDWELSWTASANDLFNT